MAQLANELQDMIIDFLHDDQDSLRACSLVCKSWLPASRFHRFRNNSRNKKKQSPISWAAESQLEDLARTLLGRDDVDVASWDKESYHPLYCVATNGNEAITKLLLARQGVSVDGKGAGIALSRAAQCGQAGIARLLLEYGNVDVNAVGFRDRDRTPLTYAAECRSIEIVKLLLGRQDIEVNTVDKASQTALHWAVRGGADSIVKLLLERNDIEVNTVDEASQTALHWAVRGGADSIVKLLLERNDIEVNTVDFDGRTALHWAVLGGSHSIVKLLLERDDVDVNIYEHRYRQTPFALATANYSVRVVKQLLERNDLDVNAMDCHGQTALRWAAQTGNRAMMKLLLGRDDIDVNRSDPLRECIRPSMLKPLKLLLERDDLKVNEIRCGDTPLIKAVDCRSEDAVRLLLARGDIDVNVKDGVEGRTPLLWAARWGYEGVVRMLLEKEGVDIYAVSKKGQTAIECAIAWGHGEVAKILLEHQRAIESTVHKPLQQQPKLLRRLLTALDAHIESLLRPGNHRTQCDS